MVEGLGQHVAEKGVGHEHHGQDDQSPADHAPGRLHDHEDGDEGQHDLGRCHIGDIGDPLLDLIGVDDQIAAAADDADDQQDIPQVPGHGGGALKLFLRRDAEQHHQGQHQVQRPVDLADGIADPGENQMVG